MNLCLAAEQGGYAPRSDSGFSQRRSPPTPEPVIPFVHPLETVTTTATTKTSSSMMKGIDSWRIST